MKRDGDFTLGSAWRRATVRFQMEGESCLVYVEEGSPDQRLALVMTHKETVALRDWLTARLKTAAEVKKSKR